MNELIDKLSETCEKCKYRGTLSMNYPCCDCLVHEQDGENLTGCVTFTKFSQIDATCIPAKLLEKAMTLQTQAIVESYVKRRTSDMKEYIWVGAKTGKIAKDNHEGLYMFDLSEGEYNLYRRCDHYLKPQDYVWVINWLGSGFNIIMCEVFMDSEKAQQRYNELKTLLNDEEVKTLRMDHMYISDYKEEHSE